MTREEIASQLESLVRMNDGNCEMECGKLLKQKEAASILLKYNQKLTFIGAELRTSCGDVDILIHCQEKDSLGDWIKKIQLWELKAPQLYQFETETNSRACPTKEFYSAENQLLHYHDELKKIRGKFNVVNDEDILFGGIIMGREDRVVNPKNVEINQAKLLARAAQRIRLNNFYGGRISLWTWDDVITSLKEITANNMMLQVQEITASDSVSLGLSEDTSITIQ